MTEFKPGDRVSIEGTVKAVSKSGYPDVILDKAWCVSTSDNAVAFQPDAPITLIERPAPPLPTEPGTTGTATVRGVPGVRVMQVEPEPTYYYYEYRWVSVPAVHRMRWHRDEHITNFVPDPDTTTRCEASGMTRYACQETDICDCFAPRVVPDPQPAPTQDDTSKTAAFEAVGGIHDPEPGKDYHDDVQALR